MTVIEVDPEIKNLLLKDEEVLLTANQSRFVPGGSMSTPNKICITNMRVIFKDPKWFGLKANMVDVNYKDISNVRLKRGIFSTEIFLKSRFLSDQVALPAVDKQIAQQITSLIQKGIRGELPRQALSEDMNRPIIAVKDEEADPMEKLREITEMKQKGILNENEYQKMKAKILGEMGVEAIPSSSSTPATDSKTIPPTPLTPTEAAEIQCKNCNVSVPASSRFCPECGNNLQLQKEKPCPACNTIVKGESKFCPDCGHKF